MTEFKVVSLFSGCGGMDLGFEGGFKYLDSEYSKNPFKVIFSNDIMEQACETLKLNFDNENVHHGDIKDIIETKNIPDTDIIIGGFPCQDFSHSGKRRGFNSERGKLYLQMKKVVEKIQPKLFVAENVKGLLTMKDAINTIKDDFSSVGTEGYIVFHKLLHSAHFGVPQSRERVIIIGVRKDIFVDKGRFQYPSKILKEDEFITSKMAIDDLKNNPLSRQDQFSKARKYPGQQGNKEIKPNSIAPTIRAEHHGNIEFHYDAERRLTVRECARIQSFPDDYEFFGSASNVYVQIGNAVPPVLAWHLAQSIGKYLSC